MTASSVDAVGSRSVPDRRGARTGLDIAPSSPTAHPNWPRGSLPSQAICEGEWAMVHALLGPLLLGGIGVLLSLWVHQYLLTGAGD